MIKKIWKDPVWSKVISAGILFLCSVAYSWFKTFVNDESFMVNWVEVLNTPFTWVIICGFILIMIYQLCRRKKFKYDEISFNQDETLFNQITTKDLPAVFFDDYFRNYDFGASFLRDKLIPLTNFESIRQNPKYEFNNPELENIKKELLSNISSFKDYLFRYTIANENGILLVLDAIKEDDKRFIIYKTTVHKLADNICETYDNLIRTMRAQRIRD